MEAFLEKIILDLGMPVFSRLNPPCRVVQNHSCMFEFTLPTPSHNRGSQYTAHPSDGTCVTELSRNFLLDPVHVL